MANEVDEVEELVNLLDENWNAVFQSFTEVDAGDSFIVSGRTITVSGLTRSEKSYISKALTSPITGDYEAEGSFEITSTTSSESIWVFGYGDTDDVIENSGVFMGIHWFNGTVVLDDNLGNSSVGALSEDTEYWWTMARTGSTNTLKVYTDSDRTSQTGSTGTLTNAGTFDRVFAVSGKDDAAGGTAVDATIFNLESATGVTTIETPTFYFTGQDVKRHDFKGGDSCLVYFTSAPANRVRGLSYTAEDSEVVLTIDFRTQLSRARMIALRDEVKRIRRDKRKDHGIGIYDLLLHVRDDQVRNYTNFWHYVIDVRLVKAVEDITT